MATPHISAEVGDFAPAVIFPGDPMRAERIAEEVLTDARRVSYVRGIPAFTGTCQGKPLSVMASGMGMPSATLYATELFQVYGVRRIVRVGTCGGIGADTRVGDVIIALGAHTDSQMNQQRLPGVNYSAVADFGLTRAAVDAATPDQRVWVGSVLSEDFFYSPVYTPDFLAKLAANGVLALEMEAAGIYGAAAQFGCQALAVLTVSDRVIGGDEANMSSEERETLFQGALRLGLAAVLS